MKNYNNNNNYNNNYNNNNYNNNYNNNIKCMVPSHMVPMISTVSVETVAGFIIDGQVPLCKGTIGGIYAEPRTGKTSLCTDILGTYKAQAESGYSFHRIYMILVDERQYEADEFEEQYSSSVVKVINAKTTAAVEETVGEARRRALAGDDVLVIMDSLSRYVALCNAQGAGAPGTGGLYPSATRALSNITQMGGCFKEHGSLTMLFTVLDSRQDKASQIICDTLRSRSNWDIYLSAELASEGIFPAIDLINSGCRREDAIKNRGDNSCYLAAKRRFGKKLPLAIKAFLDK